MTSSPHISAHKHSSNHRDELMAGSQCGCFHCLSVFPPQNVEEWVDEVDDIGTTALCPQCGIDAVIGEKSGYLITPDFLRRMKSHWFNVR